MDTLDFFIYELASYTAIDADVEDVRAYVTDLIGIDYDLNEYGRDRDGKRKRELDY